MAVTGYQFSYTTPTAATDSAGNPITVDTPTSFTIGGISEDVARGLRRGLRNVPTIANVVVSQVVNNTQQLPADTP